MAKLAVTILIFSLDVLAQTSKYDAERQRLAVDWLFENWTYSVRFRQPSAKAYDLTISIDKSRVTLEYHRPNGEVETLVLNANEKGETNTTKIGKNKNTIVSPTQWEKDILVRRYTRDCHCPTVDERIVEKYSVSKDGNTLLITQEKPSISAALNHELGPDSIEKTARKYKRKPA